MPTVHAFECGPVATMCYLVCDAHSRTAYVVDAPYGCRDLVLREVLRSGCTLSHVLLTHTHWDHTADCADLSTTTGAKVVVHEADNYRLLDPMGHSLWPLPFDIDPVPNAALLHGDSGSVSLGEGRAPLQFIHTPGHTEGGVCFIDVASKRVFVGDTLFNGSVGRTDLPGGDAEQLFSKIRDLLFALDDDYEVFPGHGPTTTIGAERRTNPFVGELA
ncbi:MAG: MBL fold metallo-hydrolase [Candidatus Kapabacteria bacterium]|nr:MBL fold metallo-hydrolase [Candidatus Kapabacteria bacterium]